MKKWPDFFSKKKAKKACKVEDVKFPEHTSISKRLDAIGRKHHGTTYCEALDEAIRNLDL